MKKTNKNFEINEDRFQLKSQIKSNLLYGDLSIIPEPFLTIVIPTYRRSKLLQDTLASVLRLEDVDFYWDVLVIDNEGYDGKPNQTEALIRKIDCPRILYYRNDENLGPIGNWNRGIELARGKWISFLHDDDLLMGFYLKRIAAYLDFYENKGGKPLGYISSAYNQFKAGSLEESPQDFTKLMAEEAFFQKAFRNKPLMNITSRQLCFTGHSGYRLPSNGTLMRKEAVMEFGGFNESLGIGNDLVLPVCMRKKYATYATLSPMGHYRWYNNLTMEKGAIHRIVEFYCDFRSYLYEQTPMLRLIGALFSEAHNEQFTNSMIEQGELYCEQTYEQSDFEDICKQKQNKYTKFLYYKILFKGYIFFEKLRQKTSGFKNTREED